MVGVQRDRDRVLVGDDVGELGERDRADDHVLDAEPGPEFCTAGGELDDAVAAGIGEALDRGVDALRSDLFGGCFLNNIRGVIWRQQAHPQAPLTGRQSQ